MFCRETSVFFVCFLHTPTMQAHRSHSPASPPRSHHKYCSGTAWRTWKRAQTPRFQCDLPPEQASSSGTTTPNSQPYRTRRIRCTDPKPLTPSLSRSELFIWAALGNCFGLFGWFNVVADRCMRATTQWTVWLRQNFVYLHVKTKLNYM